MAVSYPDECAMKFSAWQLPRAYEYTVLHASLAMVVDGVGKR
jgi:hypothetical protein